MEQLVNFIIRPPRADYSPKNDLLDQEFMLKGRWFQRRDLEVINGRGNVLQCSHYIPIEIPDGKTLPCVIYCHGNSGCRADASEAAIILLPSNITVFTLDFSGSGLSEGEHVTLGWNEKDDLKAVVNHLRTDGNVSCIGLWGRSMGAVTSLMYGAEDPSIAGMVLDSPFSNLVELMMELVDTYKYPLPKFTVKLAIQHMRKVIKKKASFDIMDLDTIQAAKCCFVPVLFGHATDDDFIHPRHSDLLHESYVGDKNIIKFDGDHNSPRPQFYFDSITIFFHNVLNPPKDVYDEHYFHTMQNFLGKDNWESVNEGEYRKPNFVGPSVELATTSTEDAITQLRSRRPMSRTDVPPDISSQEKKQGAEGNGNASDLGPSSSSRLDNADLSNGYSPFSQAIGDDEYVEYSFDAFSDIPSSTEDEERMIMEAIIESIKDLEARHPQEEPNTAPLDASKDVIVKACTDVVASEKVADSSIECKEVEALIESPQSDTDSASVKNSVGSDIITSSSSASSSVSGTGSLMQHPTAGDDGTRATLVVQQKNPTGHVLDGLAHRWGLNFFSKGR